jgi:hypothetical protein
VRLLNHRAEVARRTGAGYDATWQEEQLENAAGHNPGPLSDGAVRDILTFVIDMLARR